MTEKVNFESWVCPLPLRDHPNIIMGHGGGGQLSAELVEHLFLPVFKNDALDDLGDSAVLDLQAGLSNRSAARLSFSTDSFVVRPLFFPGGNIGHLFFGERWSPTREFSGPHDAVTDRRL